MSNNRITPNITVDNYSDGLTAANNHFSETEGTWENMRTNKIGYELQYIGGIKRERTMYENYIDSGSDNYFYFEVETKENAA